MGNRNQEKSNTPLYIVIILLAAVVAVMGVMLVKDKKSNKAAESKPVAEKSAEDPGEDEEPGDVKAEETEQEQPEEEAEVLDAFSSAKDLLAGRDVLYPGEGKAGMKITGELVGYFMKENQTDADQIQSVNICDFEENGSFEAFIFVGSKDSDESGTTFTGSVYYTDGKVCKKLADSDTDMWWTVDGLLSFEGRKFAYATEYYATGGRSLVWSVYNGEVRECDISGFGDVAQLDNGQISLVLSSYDTIYSEGMMMGHSWKPYYFDYDAKTDSLFEYGGAYLALEDVEKNCGFDLVSLLEQKGYTVTFALLRGNGILTVCYYDKTDDENVEYGNANYDCNGNCFIGWGGREAGSLEESNLGGVYDTCAVPYIARFPEVTKVKKTQQIAIRSRAELFGAGPVQLNGVNGEDWSEACSAVVDPDTEFANNAEGFIGSDIDGKTPLFWLIELSMSEDPMAFLGVYEVEVTNGHVDVIKGLYWWD